MKRVAVCLMIISLFVCGDVLAGGGAMNFFGTEAELEVAPDSSCPSCQRVRQAVVVTGYGCSGSSVTSYGCAGSSFVRSYGCNGGLGILANVHNRRQGRLSNRAHWQAVRASYGCNGH